MSTYPYPDWSPYTASVFIDPSLPHAEEIASTLTVQLRSKFGGIAGTIKINQSTEPAPVTGPDPVMVAKIETAIVDTIDTLKRFHEAKKMATGVFRRPGTRGREGEVYPDDTVTEGYNIVRADSDLPAIGSLVRYGTGGPLHGHVGRVTKIGQVYEMEVDEGVIDEDHSYSGFRKTGSNTVQVCRVYFRRGEFKLLEL